MPNKNDQFDDQPLGSFWLQTADAKIICEQHFQAYSKGRCRASFPQTSAIGSGTTISGEAQHQFSFLTVDTEGLDMNILWRLNRTGCLNLIFAESVNRRQIEDMGFRLVLREGFVAVFAHARNLRQISHGMKERVRP